MPKISSLIEIIESEKDTTEVLPTGFATLDRVLDGGFFRKELVVLGGFTGVGKSYLAGQLLYNVASKGFKTAYFSLEISNEMVASRLIGSLANVKPTRIRLGMLNPEEHEARIKAKAALLLIDDYMDFFDDVYELSKLNEVVSFGNYDFIVIDFIQNVSAPGDSEYVRLSNVALELQKLAKELNVCIMVLSQVSNQQAKETNENGVLEYKGSGSIAMVCDLGFIITRKSFNQITDLQSVQLKLRKNRRGPSQIDFDLSFQHPGGLLSEC